MKRYCYYLLALTTTILLLMPNAASAQERWEHYADRNTVTRVAFDENGEPWSLTTGGMVRWVGKALTPVDVEMPFTANILYSDDSGRMWAASGNSLYVKGENDWEQVDFGGGEYSGITTIVFNSGILGIGARDGVYICEDGVWRTYSTEDGLPYQNVTSLAIGSDGRVYAATLSPAIYKTPSHSEPDGNIGNSAKPAGDPSYTSAISVLDGNLWTTINDFASSRVFGAAYVAAAGNLLFVWRSSYYMSEGIQIYNGSTWSLLDTSNGLPSNVIRTIFPQPNDSGRVWIATNDGLCSYTNRVEKVYRTSDGLASNQVNMLAMSPEGVLWAATERGLCVLNGNTWTAHIVPGIVSNYVRQILEGSDGAMWFGTDKGVSRYVFPAWTNWSSETNPSIGEVTRMETDSQGRVFVLSGGVLRVYENGSFKKYTDLSCSSFSFDGSGRLWLFASTGIYLRDNDGEHFVVSRHNKELLAHSNDGSTWFVFDDMYLYQYDNELSNMITIPNNINNGLQHFSCDLNGHIWISNYYRLMFWDGSAWTIWQSGESGLPVNPNNVIHAPDGAHWCNGAHETYAILENGEWSAPDPASGAPTRLERDRPIVLDTIGNVWLDLYDGYARYNGSEWEKFAVDGYLLFDDPGRPWLVRKSGISILDNDDNWIVYQHGAIEEPSVHYGYIVQSQNQYFIDSRGDIWYTSGGVLRFSPSGTGVEDDTFPRPAELTIQSFPNPFNATVTIHFTIAVDGPVTVDIHSLSGQKIRTCVSQSMTAGTHSVLWNGRDDAGRIVSSGLYIARVSSGNLAAITRMTMIK